MTRSKISGNKNDSILHILHIKQNEKHLLLVLYTLFIICITIFHIYGIPLGIGYLS